MSITAEYRYAFDIQGYLHLRGAMAADEVARLRRWSDETVAATDVATLNADRPDAVKHQMNRPVSRYLDADPRFCCLLDHPVVAPLLEHFLGDYRHIDNDLYYTLPGYGGGGWHQGVLPRADGYVSEGQFTCTMVKVFWCITDVGPEQGAFAVIPGSHRAQLSYPLGQTFPAPAQHAFDDVRAGDIIIFNEALLHTGLPNPSTHRRETLIINFGRSDAGVWPGYQPAAATLAACTDRQRRILTNTAPPWTRPAEPAYQLPA